MTTTMRKRTTIRTQPSRTAMQKMTEMSSWRQQDWRSLCRSRHANLKCHLQLCLQYLCHRRRYRHLRLPWTRGCHTLKRSPRSQRPSRNPRSGSKASSTYQWSDYALFLNPGAAHPITAQRGSGWFCYDQTLRRQGSTHDRKRATSAVTNAQHRVIPLRCNV